MVAFGLLLLNILFILGILVVFYLVVRWLIGKLGLPADITYVVLFLVALLIIIYLVQNGFPKLF